ncbi:hypothetical protein LPB140_00220 [Sphingorhabdus lutea]|uniref:Uncharacterized protein n=1 Tax=Sphingorhabdus lutea TaxID=1913578 RepID=A0A1L3J8R8_9SPHN|nr:hypothetical protein [Sphingorhabdus lutea]APG61526.1 hypothetical protein LPB140_00220 [Sphingorhabdus lutea]
MELGKTINLERRLLVKTKRGEITDLKISILNVCENIDLLAFFAEIEFTGHVNMNIKIYGVDELDALKNSINYIDTQLSHICEDATLLWDDKSEY